MTPNTNNILQSNLEIVEQPSKTYCLDIENNTIIGYCDGIEAMKQTIYCILNTERFEHLIYSWNFGIELKNLIGESSTYVVPELQRVITEALVQDDRIEEVNNFNFEINKNKITVTFNVITTVGEITIEKVVNV
ncbi:MAG: DUF2634 domain-containing protein [Clostridia bacterium]|nr:DUF2634 domain-containing protein [Clostridia bacterium]